MAQSSAENIPAREAVLAEGEAQRPAATVSDFRALWIKDALFLTRRVSLDGASAIQGAWVDWPQLRTSLLAAISDLFPAASLEPAPASTSGGSDLLAALPIRFLPGRLEISSPPFWSPLKLSLATAWGCVLLASVAVAMVLRGMMLLSERRAAFVSAVTHELRTPLATFKLYSEMLADGLVKDPAKRQSYLETLTTEADRLGHLVENVLSYSRLERGKAAEGQIPVILRDLLHRVEPRLHQRVSQAGAEFSIHHETIPDDFALTTDPAAVEQILFNLVDNACKYAVRDGIPAQLELVLTPAPAALQLALRDHGPGLTRAEARKLFRPFHKSARDAAHSAPGVGLGLALCRRLARDLGGTLEIDHTWPHGACFVLTLPVPA
jgi:signal transduction histidine kinase